MFFLKHEKTKLHVAASNIESKEQRAKTKEQRIKKARTENKNASFCKLIDYKMNMSDYFIRYLCAKLLLLPIIMLQYLF